jgi:hypothetical protein
MSELSAEEETSFVNYDKSLNLGNFDVKNL